MKKRSILVLPVCAAALPVIIYFFPLVWPAPYPTMDDFGVFLKSRKESSGVNKLDSLPSNQARKDFFFQPRDVVEFDWITGILKAGGVEAEEYRIFSIEAKGAQLIFRFHDEDDARRAYELLLKTFQSEKDAPEGYSYSESPASDSRLQTWTNFVFFCANGCGCFDWYSECASDWSRFIRHAKSGPQRRERFWRQFF